MVYTDPNGCVSTSNTVTLSSLVSTNIWVYPNPNLGQFNVRFYNLPNERVRIQVMNMLGQVFKEVEVTAANTPYSNTVINLGPTAAAGEYIVRVITSNGRELARKQIIVGR